ncbi:hypothetical protein GGI07_003167 [Coemansia sp. Benny D115]|nr:hypothetical protein GGI07_003167 [Coemansia sp. Benny D115]
MLQYGFLQGTFGLPYGGYCVQPKVLNDIVLNADSPYLQMFCVIGKYSEVMRWLEGNDRMVANQCTSQDTFTHDLIVEVYTKAPKLVQLLRGKGNSTVQLVIRIARTWDRSSKSGRGTDQFKPMVKSIVPSGITLAEIFDELAGASPGDVVDATVNKALLDVVLSRVSTRTLATAAQQQQQQAPASPSGSSRSGFLPVYEYSRELPPSYYE